MIDNYTCPLCKYNVSFEISEDKNSKLVKCDTCREFIISYDAEPLVIRTVVKKAELSQISSHLEDDQMLYIYTENNQIQYKIIPKK
jgi:hypothetical protein